MRAPGYQLSILYALLGAVAYCVPMGFFLHQIDAYSGLYLLYVGNFLFFLVVVGSVIHFSTRSKPRMGLPSVLRFGARVTLIMVVTSLIVTFIFFLASSKNLRLSQVPAGMDSGKHDGLWGAIFMNLILVNCLIGLFAALIAGVSSRPGK